MARLLTILLLASCFNPTDFIPPGSSGTSGSSGISESSSGISSGSSGLPPTTTGGSEGTSSGSPIDSTSGSTQEVSGSSTGAPTTSAGSPPDPICGNGLKEEGEACDDGNGVEGDGCTPTCVKDALFVFVTSSIRSPNLGSVEEADAFCMAQAAEGIVPPATYVAWLSTKGLSVLLRMKDNPSLPYIRPDMMPVAVNLLDLLDTTLLNPINVTEHGDMLDTGPDCRTDVLAWTGTQATGMSAILTCEDWTTAQAGADGTTGRVQSMVGSWSAGCISPCNASYHFYCIEQP